jgi:diaminohydroxyphosphoribosylaminopyrimidine deaminase/5-amino-6-(5-phosphoribosylamino)uracil reductase
MAAKDKRKQLQALGIEILITPMNNKRVDLAYLMKALGERQMDSVLLEGGSEVNYSAIEAGIVDKVLTFIAPKIIGGREAKTSVGGPGRVYMKDAINLTELEVHRFDEDIMLETYVRREG